MARGYLIFIVLAGLFATMIGGSMSSDPAEVTPTQRVLPANRSSEQANVEYGRVAEEGVVELERRSDGHFYADVEVNGATIRALVDTGASAIALSRADALSAAVPTSVGMPGVVGRGADGEVYGEQVTLERVVLGHRAAENMPAIVLNSGEQTLLGQSFLAKFESVEIRGDRMVLR